MALYHYTAIDSGGAVEHGTMEAISEAAVVATLQRQRRFPVRTEPAVRATAGRPWTASFATRRMSLSREELARFTRELATMLGAGQDLDSTLRHAVDGATSRRIAAAARRIRERIRGGSTLTTALAEDAGAFPRLYVGLVRAGEAGGSLAETLRRLAALIERERDLTARVQSAMIYPAVLAAAMIGSIVLLLTTVLPQFVPFFRENGVTLPLSTRLLLDVGAITSAAWPWTVAAMIVGALGLQRLLRRPGPRLAADRIVLRLPIVGGLVQQVLAARFTRTLGSLLTNGVPLLAALNIAKDTLSNAVAVAAVAAATETAKQGVRLTQTLAHARVFPARMMHLLQLGEDTAQLGELALRAADIHDEEIRLRLDRLVSLLVPAITIVMGLAVAAIVASLFMAMLSLNDLVS